MRSRYSKVNPETAVEALTPDFSGNQACVATVVNSGLQVFAQNVETVKRLTQRVRDPRAGYQQTLDVLAFAKQEQSSILTKTSLMLGLGEQDDEIIHAMEDMRAHGVDILTLGQYPQPTKTTYLLNDGCIPMNLLAIVNRVLRWASLK